MEIQSKVMYIVTVTDKQKVRDKVYFIRLIDWFMTFLHF